MIMDVIGMRIMMMMMMMMMMMIHAHDDGLMTATEIDTAMSTAEMPRGEQRRGEASENLLRRK